MNKRKMLIMFCLAAAVMISACAEDEITQEYISGAKRRSQKQTEMICNVTSTIYTVPEMDEVLVKVNETYADERFMDIYYPPDFEFNEKLPAVVCHNGFAGLKAKGMGRMIDWASLIAAHGMIAVTYDAVFPEKDIELLFDSITARNEELHIDTANVGMISYCGDCPTALKTFLDSDCSYSEVLKTGVFLYGPMPWDDRVRTDSSFLLVKTGKGLESYVAESIDSFAVEAESRGGSVTVFDYEKGYKYFDVTEQPHSPLEYGVNYQYTADCDMMKEILSWLDVQMHRPI